MTRIVWEYEHPRRAVWQACLDADQWPIGFDGFSPVPGVKFNSGLFPTLSTEYAGWLECQVITTTEFEYVAVQVVAPKHGGASQTCWELRCHLSDTPGGGTSAVTKICGVNPDDHDERVLLNIVGPLVRWVYAHANDRLNYPDRDITGRLGPHRKTGPNQPGNDHSTGTASA